MLHWLSQKLWHKFHVMTLERPWKVWGKSDSRFPIQPRKKSVNFVPASHRVEIWNFMVCFFLKGTLVEPKTLAEVSSDDTQGSWEVWGENWLMVSYSAQKKICQFRSSKPQGPNFYDGMVFLKGTLVEPKAVAGVLSYDTEGPWQVWEKTKLVVSYLAQKKSVNFVSCQILAFSPARRNFTSFW